MRVIYLLVAISLFSCTDTRSENQQQIDLYEAHQKSFNAHYARFEVKFLASANEIGKKEVYDNYHSFLKAYLKDSLDNVKNWIGRLKSVRLYDSTVNFTIDTESGLFVANVGKSSELAKMVATISETQQVIFSGRLKDTTFSYSDFSDYSMPRFFVDFNVDSLRRL